MYYFKQFDKLIEQIKKGYSLPVFIDWSGGEYNYIMNLLDDEGLELLQEVQKEMEELGLQGDAEVYLYQAFISEVYFKSSFQCNMLYNFSVDELPYCIYYNDAEEAIKLMKFLFSNEPLKCRLIEISILAKERELWLEEQTRLIRQREKEEEQG